MYKHFFKRVIDFTLALLALLAICPLLLCVTIWLHFANNGAGAFSSKRGLDFMAKYSRLSSSRRLNRFILRQSVEFASVEALDICRMKLSKSS